MGDTAHEDSVWQARLATLAQLAETTKSRWDESVVIQRTRNHPPRPFFVEFSGTPKSGKSSTIEVVRHFFRRNGFRVLAPAEGASRRTPEFLKDDLVFFNVWSGCYSLTHLLERAKEDAPYDLVLLDRGLFDVACWVEYLATNNLILPAEADAVRQFFSLERWKALIDLVVLMTVDPATAMTREYQDRLTLAKGRAMNESFLRDINDAYARVARTLGPAFPEFVHLDTGDPNGSLREGSYTVVEAALNGMTTHANRIWQRK